MKYTKKIICSTMLFSATYCFAVPSSPDIFESKYQQSFSVPTQEPKFEINTVTKIPKATYNYLENVFSSFYNKVAFNTEITSSTFKDGLQSDVFSLPLIANNSKGIKLELFGNFCDLSKQYLSNLSTDHALYNSLANSQQTDLLNDDIALGAGVSFNTGKSSKIKIIMSNNDMPGYGNSRTLVGFETSF
jgi:hypothetical protein